MSFSIVVPTYRRQHSLSHLLAELRKQITKTDRYVEIVVVDNCPDGTAKAVTDAVQGPVLYVHAESIGIANARNAGVRAATGAYVIFIDDDQLPCPEWLDAYIVAADQGWKACFGVVAPKFGIEPSEQMLPIVAGLFSRDLGVPTGTDVTAARAKLGTGNSMFAKRTCFPDGEPFDVRFNGGGEDVWYLRQAALAGIQFFWSAEASVQEVVPEARMRYDYLGQRLFRNGQLRCIVEFGRPSMRNWPGLIFWMSVGLAQACGYGFMMIVTRPFDKEKHETFRVKSLGGVGKVKWWKMFQ